MGWDKLSGTGVSQKKFHTARAAQLVACPHSNFLKILSSKRVCCVFRDIRDKNAVNQGFWSKTAVFSLPATKMHCLLIFPPLLHSPQSSVLSPQS